MQARFEITQGLDKLKQIIASLPIESAHWNEAQNRFQFIDRLLTECVGWERPNMSVEVSDDLGGKSDYILGQPVKAILEAKREAKLFNNLPVGNPSVVRKLKPMLLASKTFKEAVHQVLSYSVLHGAQIAVVCNGPQMAIFQAMIPGLSPLDGECYFFNGFQSYEKNGSSQKSVHVERDWELKSMSSIRYLGVSTRPSPHFSPIVR